LSKILAPMKGEDFVEEELRFPYFASFKLDGFRAFVEGGVLRTSSGKPVANEYCQHLFGKADYEGLDGELVVGSWNDKAAFKNTSGPVRRRVGSPDVRWYLFDDRSIPTQTFMTRHQQVCRRRESAFHAHGHHTRLEIVPQNAVLDRNDLAGFENSAIASGFEGVMLRSPEGHYKFGRSTVRENLLLKVKRFVTDEAVIEGFTERVRYEIEGEENDLGRSVKSEAKANAVPTGMVGSFIVRSNKFDKSFSISAGSLSHDEAKEAFEQFDELYKGELASYEYFPHGTQDVPRHGIFRAIRGREDMTE
jgi:DNA ligase 1